MDGTPKDYEHQAEGDYTITVSTTGLTEAAEIALFERVAAAAHALGEPVACFGTDVPVPSPDEALAVARYLRKASRSPKRHPDTRAAMLRVATVLDPSGRG